MDMKKEIKARLSQVEKDKNVRILYAVESGSRAWGFASADSDYDVRFIYARSAEEYLRIDEVPDFIEWQLDEVYDINGWDLGKALIQLSKGNAVFFEWLNSPVVYRTSDEWETVRRAACSYFSVKAALRHYCGLAKNTFQTYLNNREDVSIKKYFYALRPLLAARYIDNTHEPPPVEFAELMKQDMPDDLRSSINQLLEMKVKTGEGQKFPAIPLINSFIENELKVCCEKSAAAENDRKTDCSPLNAVYRKIILKDCRIF
jgi:predicted nucleotidyltransferase